MAIKLEIWHRDYNLDKKDNLNEIPENEAVFGIFGIVNDEPVNCRLVSAAENLRESVKNVFENPADPGLRKFMQGPWIQMLQYELVTGSSADQRRLLVEEWKEQHKPAIDDDGDYPGYYDV